MIEVYVTVNVHNRSDHGLVANNNDDYFTIGHFLSVFTQVIMEYDLR